VPYDLLNRLNRQRLQQRHTGLVGQVTVDDYHFSEQARDGFDFFCLARKKA
jgi:hypothetical protein